MNTQIKALIVAVDEDYGIGKKGVIPWHYSEDMKFFSQITKNSSCIMGRKTYDDIAEIMKNKKSLLPNRECFVITSRPETVEKATPVSNIEEALKLVTRENIFFIGGESIYKASLPYIQTAFVTYINGKHDCDVFIKETIQKIEEQFEKINTINAETDDICFVKYQRRS